MTDDLMSNEDAIAASVSGAQARESSAEKSPYGASEAAWIASALVCREVAELPDRTSSGINPDEMIVTGDELQPIVAQALDVFAAQAAADYYESHEALTDLVALWSEYEALTGGGLGWRGRFKEAFDRACELTRKEP